MKTYPHSVLAASLLSLLPLLSLPMTAQDLPYSSGSTGADGVLAIPTIFPNAGPRGGAAFHTGENALYYASSFYVWRSTDGKAWTRLPDIPGNYSNHGDYTRAQLAYDSQEEALYALVNTYNQNTGYWEPKCHKWASSAWQLASTGLPESLTYDSDWWNRGRMVYDSARDQLVVFAVGSSYNETWTFDGTSWTQQTPATIPSGRINPQMAYDSVRQETLLYGGEGASDTWVWNGTTWTSKPTVFSPPSLSNHPAYWHSGYQGIVIPETGRNLWLWTGSEWELKHASGFTTGSMSGYVGIENPITGDFLAILNSQVVGLKNDVWTFKAGNPYYIDLSTRPNGVFHYTDIVVPTGMTVKFLRNSANTPVFWLASGFVQINGTVDVSGSGFSGGPGGYDGANGLMTIGQGPGGGFPTDQMGGRYLGIYGNPQIEPLIGGSGGGRMESNSTVGTGGGGAILIASSRDIIITGSILANSEGKPGYYEDGAGSGSGGSIKLVGDRVSGSGSLAANSGWVINTYNDYPNKIGSSGRIRIEAYETDMVDNASPLASNATSPVWTPASLASQLEYELNVTQVAETAVRQPPTGQTGNPDVSFSSDQPITVVVNGRNIPDGTEIKLMIGGNGINTTLPLSGEPAVTMQAGSATFPNITIPTGLGHIQASAAFQKPAATP